MHGEGRVPTLLAFLYGRTSSARRDRLGRVWIARAVRDTTQGADNSRPFIAAALAELRLDQSRLAEARAAAGRLPADRRGQRATAAMLRGRLRRAEGDARGASALLERELGALLADGSRA